MYEAVKAGVIIGILTGLIVYLASYYNSATIGLLATFPLSIIYLFFIQDEKTDDFAKMFILGSLIYFSFVFVFYKIYDYDHNKAAYVSIGLWVLMFIILYILR